MKKPKQFVVGIIISIIGLITGFLPLIDGIPSEIRSITMLLVFFGIVIIICSFDLTKLGIIYNRGKRLLGIVVDENFYTNGVNVFDYWDANKKKTIHIKYETAIGTEWKYKIVNYVATVVKVKGKSMEFNAYIVEFSMAKYAIFVVNSVADKLTFSNTFKDDDNKLNYEYKVKAALSHEEQNAQTDCCDIIYSKDKSKRALIIQKDNYYRIFVENIKFESNQDLYYRDCISFPFWFWERDDTYTSSVDTLENAIKNAKEYLK